MAYNNYEVKLNDNENLKLDCAYDDTSMLIIEKESEIVDSFEILNAYISEVSSAIVYLLNIDNDDIKITRNVSDDPCWRYSISYNNQILKIRYTEDGNEEVTSEIKININNNIEKIKKFFDLIKKYESRGT